MQHVSKLTPTNSQLTSTSSQEPKRLADNRVKRVFALMQANYGARWKDQTGSGTALKLAMKVWAEKLEPLSDEQLKHGLDNLPEDFCPTPAKFKMLCNTGEKGLSHNTAAYRKFDKSKALEKKADPETAKQAMQKIRQMMNKAGARSHV